MEDARRHWNDRYLEGAGAIEPSPFLVGLASLLPPAGRALDVGGGRGRHAVWLAQRGLDVTLVDISEVALDLAARAAAESGVTIRLIQADLTADPLPAGPWDVVVLFHYLQRDLFSYLDATLDDAGLLIAVLATVRNLERHERPPRRYLLDEGELPSLAAAFEVLRYEEGWLDEGRHEARLVARKRR